MVHAQADAAYLVCSWRKIDSEPIRTAIDEIDRGQKRKAHEFHQIEKMRDRLLEGSDLLFSRKLPHVSLRWISRKFVSSCGVPEKKRKKEDLQSSQGSSSSISGKFTRKGNKSYQTGITHIFALFLVLWYY